MPMRPASDDCTTGAELDRWYWTRDELVTMARARGVPATGSKHELASALRAHLDGRPAHVPVAARRMAAPALPEPLTRSTALPAGQRCTQQLRRFCVGELGQKFRFDGPVRAFVATSDGTSTLGDLVDHWHRTRSVAPGEIAPQFELNRFLRRWYLEHPGGGRRAAVEAWREHRSLPAEQRS